jgi:hypothetical protein
VADPTLSQLPAPPSCPLGHPYVAVMGAVGMPGEARTQLNPSVVALTDVHVPVHPGQALHWLLTHWLFWVHQHGVVAEHAVVVPPASHAPVVQA